MNKFKFLFVLAFALTFYACEESASDNYADIQNLKSQPCKPGQMPCPNDGGGSGTSAYDEGYADGYAEGRNLALIPDPITYDQLWKSYNSYPANFPDYPQNFSYFKGKYLGIVDGWLNNFNPSPCTTIECMFPTNGDYVDVDWDMVWTNWSN